ncbi:class I SAM-dependent methyltransferase [Ensifer sesbaniae]|uniref:class I SAM-dependent methyltransferase n=1 Tax=Ensifer sesbaniae TaxID=1214071 RepID=UPI001569C925|nr:class I SAM-dependent methyltransferase [Ensifer sesbaniae]NRQ18222.1 tRNA (mo5U34)-methyltransferase [Ensifer sesbaniae]
MLKYWRKLKQKNTNLETVDSVFDQYTKSAPSHQNAIDALQGWNSAFPSSLKLRAGQHPLFADGRIAWALQQFGSIENKTVLEIGPLEAMHTYMLNIKRPAKIDAVEANQLCFLRCLVTKEILDLDRAHFYLGDALRWLETHDERYDLAVASGVLYHMADPAEFLCRLADRSDSLFIWTHFFDDAAMPAHDVRRTPFTGRVEERVVKDLKLRYYERGYLQANANKSFCGGMKDRHFWMHRDEILKLLNALGFNNITINNEQPDHKGGPCFSLFARR